MGERERYHIALAAVFLLALALKLYFTTQEPLIYNNDAGYYVEHIDEVLAQGYPDVADPPLAFYYAAAFASVLGTMLGFKAAIALASAGIAFPVFMIARHISGRWDLGLAAAFLAAFSGTNMLMMGDLLKNMLGLFFGAWFVYFLVRATDRFDTRDAALAALSALLMLGSHFSSGAYVVASVAPFLLLKPAYAIHRGRKLEAGDLLCLAALGALAAAAIGVALLWGWDVSSGKVGVISIHEGGWNLDYLQRYGVFFLPMFLALIPMGRERLMLFLPWIGISLILGQGFLAQEGWTQRFEWNSYVLVALLSGLGLGYLRERKAFWGAFILLGALSLIGFVQAGSGIHPIISQGEWEWLRGLHERRPDISFARVEGGMQQWLSASGFRAGGPEGTHLLVCDAQSGGNQWAMGACSMAFRASPERIREMPVEESYGRFYVVPVEAFQETIGN